MPDAGVLSAATDQGSAFSFDDLLKRLATQKALAPNPITVTANPAAAPASPATGLTFEQLQSLLERNRATTAASLAGSNKQLQQIAAEKTEVPTPPEPAPLQRRDLAALKEQLQAPMRAMSSPMMLLAVLGGGAIGGNMAAAFKAGAGYLNGVTKGALENVAQDKQAFDDNLKAGIAENTQKLEKYRAILAREDTKIAQKANQLRAVAMEHNDTIALAQLDQGDIRAMVEFAAAQASAQRTIINEQLQMQHAIAASMGQPQMLTLSDGKQVLAQQDKAGALGKPGAWYTADERHEPVDSAKITAMSPTSQAMAPAQEESIVDLIGTYRAPPLSSFALRTVSGQRIMADVAAKYPDYNANQYPMIGRTMTAFTTGQQGQRLTSINVAIQHLNVMRRLSDALHSGDVRAVNAAKQEWEKAFGSAAPTNFDAVKQIVGQEVVKAIVNTGGGVTERQEAQNTFNRVGSPAQLSGAIDSVEALLAGQVAGLKHQYESATGTTPGVIPFEDFLLPETKDALGNPNLVPGTTGGAAAPAATPPLSALRPPPSPFGVSPKLGAPTLMQFLERNRPVNPGVSDEELAKYWREKYGGQ